MDNKIYVYNNYGYGDSSLAEFSSENEAAEHINAGIRRGGSFDDYTVVKGYELKIEPIEIVKSVRLVSHD